MIARYGGTIVHSETFDTGGMFNWKRGVEELPETSGRQLRFRAYVQTGWGGGAQCFRATRDQAVAELERLTARLSSGWTL